VELPLFALHTVLYPGQSLRVHVFEERYRRMMADVLPVGRFAVVAIRTGREVGGPYEPYAVGVECEPLEHVRYEDGRFDLEATALRRVRLIERISDEPYPRWSMEPFPEADDGAPDLVARATEKARYYVSCMGSDPALLKVPADRVAASYALARVVPGLVPDRQAYLELPGTSERLQGVTGGQQPREAEPSGNRLLHSPWPKDAAEGSGLRKRNREAED
jgi:Lon protease-like protein